VVTGVTVDVDRLVTVTFLAAFNLFHCCWLSLFSHLEQKNTLMVHACSLESGSLFLHLSNKNGVLFKVPVKHVFSKHKLFSGFLLLYICFDSK